VTYRSQSLTILCNTVAVLELQTNTLDLLISQQSVPHFPLRAIQQSVGDDSHRIMESLYGCLLAANPVTSRFLALPSGYEHFLSNLEWIMLSWSISFSARLDVLAGNPYLAQYSQLLRQRLDFRHTLRQVILRLESMMSPLEDGSGDRDVFFHFLKRARSVEAWYLRHTGLESLSTPGSVATAASQAGSTSREITGAEPVLLSHPSETGHVLAADMSFGDYFPQEIQDADFGMFLAMQDFDLF
jgi:hypothetical protein